MSETPEFEDVSPKITSLLTFLKSDADNLNLLSDIADLALNEQRPDIARAMLKRFNAISPMPEKEMHMAGLAAMQSDDFEEAANIYQILRDGRDDAPGLNYNLAWSLAKVDRLEEALSFLDEPTVSELPQAASLEIQLLHRLDRFAEAEDRVKVHRVLHPTDPDVNAVISVFAIDSEDVTLAKVSAKAAGEHTDAYSTMGTLALLEEDRGEAKDYFERSLDLNGQNARSLVGLGLVHLGGADSSTATTFIDKGAGLFGDHIGSWIAAGWAHYIKGDLETSKSRFEAALALDANFSESHGSLAVIDVVQNRPVEARRRIRTALGLDQKCFSAILAQTLLLSAQGQPDQARALFDKALHTPMDNTGRTISQSLSRLGLKSS